MRRIDLQTYNAPSNSAIELHKIHLHHAHTNERHQYHPNQWSSDCVEYTCHQALEPSTYEVDRHPRASYLGPYSSQGPVQLPSAEIERHWMSGRWYGTLVVERERERSQVLLGLYIEVVQVRAWRIELELAGHRDLRRQPSGRQRVVVGSRLQAGGC